MALLSRPLKLLVLGVVIASASEQTAERTVANSTQQLRGRRATAASPEDEEDEEDEEAEENEEAEEDDEDDEVDEDDEDDEAEEKDVPPAKKAAPHWVAGYQEPLTKEPPRLAPEADKTTPPIVIKGNMLYDSGTGNRFFAKGVAYNPRNTVFDRGSMKHGNCTAGEPEVRKLAYAEDPAADKHEDTWSPALEAMAAMGANTVRLYNIDPLISHEKFMTKASSLGLYVIIPLTRHDWGFLPAGSPSPFCYTEELPEYGNVGTNVLVSAKLIVKQFSQYDNVLMFTVANEMTVAEVNGYAAFPCVKALTRDIHRYQKTCRKGMRRIPLIYSDMDMGPPYRELVGRYLTCELESKDDAVDAYGLNVYSWCDPSYPDTTGKHNFEYSPYGPIRKEFSKFSKPLLFSEFGCNVGAFETFCPYRAGRTWVDVPTFFNEFKEVMSGAIAFEFSMEDNQYGLTLTSGFTSDPRNEGKIYALDAFYALKKEFVSNEVADTWDGAEVSSCTWKPDDAHEMKYSHGDQRCPKKKEVRKLFKAKGLSVKPNWGSLPPKPDNTESDELAVCAEYEVAPSLQKEGCCHMDCSAARRRRRRRRSA